MADFESIIKKYVADSGEIPAEAIETLTKAINTAVGNGFVDKERYKAKLTEIDNLKTEKQTAEDNATTAGKWETKYKSLKEDFDAYKADQTAKETRAAKETAYRELLKAAGIPEKRLAAVLRVSDLDSVELGDDGKIKDADKLTENIKIEWADFIPTTTTQGAQTSTPPATNTGTNKDENILAVRKAMGLPVE